MGFKWWFDLFVLVWLICWGISELVQAKNIRTAICRIGVRISATFLVVYAFVILVGLFDI